MKKCSFVKDYHLSTLGLKEGVGYVGTTYIKTFKRELAWATDKWLRVISYLLRN